jgi:hypothetical protein
VRGVAVISCGETDAPLHQVEIRNEWNSTMKAGERKPRMIPVSPAGKKGNTPLFYSFLPRLHYLFISAFFYF